jgi:deoxyribodipyrimidine photo-lyase
VIWWLRRDLRLAHNPALQAALDAGSGVLPVFILDPALLRRPAEKRQGFLFASLRALDAQLRARGSRLIVRAGQPLAELRRLVQESGASAIFASEDFSPYARRRDGAIASELPLRLTGGLTVHPPAAVKKADGNPYTIFTPFSKAWKALPLGRTAPADLPAVFPPVSPFESLPIPAGEAPAGFPAGEDEAQRRLAQFLDGPIFQYSQERNRLDLAGTSALSPYLRFGMLSSRQAAQAVAAAARQAPDAAARVGAETWLNELIWREFYLSILFHFPYVLREAFQPGLRAIPWRDAPQDLQAWQSGQTGVPVVDAAMRQLLESGWMHNRARMISASFLVKNLLIDWQEGERWFMRHLVDGDPAANNGGWQWTAGVGTDAAPYFRIFNPVLQSARFDPEGAYIRRWVPELARIPDEWIHTPWLMPLEQQRQVHCRIGVDYPAPIVDMTTTKERTLAAYRASKEAGRY